MTENEQKEFYKKDIPLMEKESKKIEKKQKFLKAFKDETLWLLIFAFICETFAVIFAILGNQQPSEKEYQIAKFGYYDITKEYLPTNKWDIISAILISTGIVVVFLAVANAAIKEIKDNKKW